MHIYLWTALRIVVFEKTRLCYLTGQAAEDPLRVKGTLKKGASRLKELF
jgi:hypothetical protein